jgi:hypothetical protein
MELAAFGTKLDATEHEHCRPRRNTTRNDAQLGSQFVLGDGYPQAGAHYGF